MKISCNLLEELVQNLEIKTPSFQKGFCIICGKECLENEICNNCSIDYRSFQSQYALIDIRSEIKEKEDQVRFYLEELLLEYLK